jgi:hypothetical protein
LHTQTLVSFVLFLPEKIAAPSFGAAEKKNERRKMLLIVLLSFILLHFSCCTAAPAQQSKHVTALSSIGISLSPNHATLSLRHSDGSFEDVGYIAGSSEYRNMMRRHRLKDR